MAESLSILEFLQKMIDNTSLRDWFARDPQGALAHYDLKDVSPEDVRDAIVLADDSQTADFSRSYDTGFRGSLSHGSDHHTSGNNEHHYAGHSSGHQEAIEHLSRYVTNNFVDDRDTNVDDSVNQQIHTHGGDVDQFIRTDSTTASGDGAVAAHGDITGSTLTTGDGNQVGDGNIKGDNNVQGNNDQVVHGDHNTTAFGAGAANSADLHDVSVSNGGALSVAGPANGFQDTTDSHNQTTTTTTDTTHIEDSGNLHADTTTDSDNDLRQSTSTDSHDHTHTDIDSHNHVDLPVT
ncbi:MAG TPA: hypothetical protein VGE11_25390 [Pseudonocardia sp.]